LKEQTQKKIPSRTMWFWAWLPRPMCFSVCFW
jgi:hypothetical protein